MARKSKETKQITARITRECAQALDDHHWETRIGKGAIIEAALNAYLGGVKKLTPVDAAPSPARAPARPVAQADGQLVPQGGLQPSRPAAAPAGFAPAVLETLKYLRANNAPTTAENVAGRLRKVRVEALKARLNADEITQDQYDAGSTEEFNRAVATQAELEAIHGKGDLL